MLLPVWVPLLPTYPTVATMLRGSSRWMSRLHFQTSPSLMSGLACRTATGRFTATPPDLVRNGSSSVRTGDPSRYLRVTSCDTVPSVPVVGVVWEASDRE